MHIINKDRIKVFQFIQIVLSNSDKWLCYLDVQDSSCFENVKTLLMLQTPELCFVWI